MPYDPHYAAEKIGNTLYELAIGDGTARERFKKAYKDQGAHGAGGGTARTPEPSSDAEALVWELRDAVTAGGTLDETIDGMDDGQFHELVYLLIRTDRALR